MNTPFDQNIRQQIRTEAQPALPDFVHEMTEATLAALPDKLPMPRRRSASWKRLTVAAACTALLALGVLPNVSPAYAQAAGQLPIIGQLVQVLTVRNYTYDDGSHQLDAEIPGLTDPDNTAAADLINADIQTLTADAIGRFYSQLEPDNNGYGSIHIDYETITSSDRWFTLQLRVSETAGSSDTYLRYYHIDRKAGRYVSFSDLFAREHYAVLEEYILQEMENRMAADANVSFWTDSDAIGEAFNALTDDQAFYFTAEGALVIVYDKYEVAPGAMGNPAFMIPKDVYTPCLK